MLLLTMYIRNLPAVSDSVSAHVAKMIPYQVFLFGAVEIIHFSRDKLHALHACTLVHLNTCTLDNVKRAGPKVSNIYYHRFCSHRMVEWRAVLPTTLLWCASRNLWAVHRLLISSSSWWHLPVRSSTNTWLSFWRKVSTLTVSGLILSNLFIAKIRRGRYPSILSKKYLA